MSDPLAVIDWPVRTSRLLLRRATADDLEPTWRFRRLPEVVEWVTAAPVDLADYRSIYLHPDRLLSTVVIERDDEVIGDVLVRVEDGWAQREAEPGATGVQAELGWTLDPAHCGHGYATEAVRAVVDLCFGPLRLRRVHAGCFADNVPSWRLMERIGMRRELHAVRESLHRNRGWLDGYGYALLAEEWRGHSADR